MNPRKLVTLPEDTNVNYLKDIHSTPIALGSQFGRDRGSINRRKQRHYTTIKKMKSYIITAFRIQHITNINDLCAWLKDTWDFELGFLPKHNSLDSSAYHPVCYPLCSAHSNVNLPRKKFSLLDKDRRRTRIAIDDIMIYIREHLEQGDTKNDPTIPQLHHNIEIKTPSYILHNIYQVLFRAMYQCSYYSFLPKPVINVTGLSAWSHHPI